MPTPSPSERLTRQRLQAWGDRLVMVQATPLLLIGVGHGAATGELHICIPTDLPQERQRLTAVLRQTLARLEAGDV
jgi:hypothetical protein